MAASMHPSQYQSGSTWSNVVDTSKDRWSSLESGRQSGECERDVDEVDGDGWWRVCVRQWTAAGRRGRRGRRAAPTVDIIDEERATIQRRNTTDDTASAATSTRATAPEHSAEVRRLFVIEDFVIICNNLYSPIAILLLAILRNNGAGYIPHGIP